MHVGPVSGWVPPLPGVLPPLLRLSMSWWVPSLPWVPSSPLCCFGLQSWPCQRLRFWCRFRAGPLHIGPLRVGRPCLSCLFHLAFMVHFYLVLLPPLYNIRLGLVGGKVQSGEFMCLCHCGDLVVVGALPVAQAGFLVGPVLSHGRGGGIRCFGTRDRNVKDLDRCHSLVWHRFMMVAAACKGRPSVFLVLNVGS